MTLARRWKFAPSFALELEDRNLLATYFVAPGGNDAASGSSATPWATLQYAANKVAPGDEVVVRAGNYVGFELTTSGTAGARITFRADPGVTINQAETVTPGRGAGINLEAASYVTIQGFNVVGMPTVGIRSVLNEFVQIVGNNCDQNGTWGILTGFSEDVLIEGNTTSRSGKEHGIYVSNSADRPIIRGNTSWGNKANGIHMNGDIFAQGGDGILSNALVENNVIFGNGTGGGSGINCDGVQNSIIRNNVIYDTHASGISLYQIDGGGPSTGNLVANNTVIVASDGRWALNIRDGSTGNTVRNNIFFSYQSNRGAISISADSLSGFTSDFNVVEDRFTTTDGTSALTFSQWQALGYDANSVTVADPATLFVNLAAGDLHLRAGSLAIDRGTTANAPPLDFEGQVRPAGAGIDVGADEFGASPPGGGGGGGGGGSGGGGGGGSGGGGGVGPPPRVFAAGTDAGGSGVRVFNADGGVRFVADPFPGFTGGVRVATADVTGDGIADLIVGAGPGGSPVVVVIDGQTQAEIARFLAFEPSFNGGVYVAAGDFDRDSKAEIVVTPDRGGGPVVAIFNSAGGELVRFLGIRDDAFRGGARAAIGDVTGDGIPDVVVSAGFLGGPRISIWSGVGLAAGVAPDGEPLANFFAFEDRLRNGAFVAVADVTGDNRADLIFGGGPGGSPRVRIGDGAKLLAAGNFGSFDAIPDAEIANFFSGPDTNRGGIRVAVANLDGDGFADVLTGSGERDGGRVVGYSGATLRASAPPPASLDFAAFDFPGGVFVG